MKHSCKETNDKIQLVIHNTVGRENLAIKEINNTISQGKVYVIFNYHCDLCCIQQQEIQTSFSETVHSICRTVTWFHRI